eukprot:gene16367-biopygen16487
MVSIFSFTDAPSSYKNLKSDPFSAARITASAASTAPLPPFAQWFETTQSKAPASFDSFFTRLISSSVSQVNWFSTTTAGTPNFAKFWMCRSRFAKPVRTASTAGMLAFETGTPAWNLSARHCSVSLWVDKRVRLEVCRFA